VPWFEGRTAYGTASSKPGRNGQPQQPGYLIVLLEALVPTAEQGWNLQAAGTTAVE
jgi:hypothetical protein